MKTDSQLQKDVIQQLTWDPSVNHEHIGVSVSICIVTLSGHVPSFIEKLAIERAVQRVAGVKAIVEKIEVKVPSIYSRDDEDIARAVLNQFKWSVQIPDKDIKICVENGCVTLAGEVSWAFQKNAAYRAIQDLMGVKSITNNITLKEKKIDIAKVKQNIEEALKRAAKKESDKIAVEISGNKVILSGDVHSFSEMEDAKWAAWSAPGVNAVENRMGVSH